MAAVIDQHRTHVNQKAGRVDFEQVVVTNVRVTAGIDVHDEGHEARSDSAFARLAGWARRSAVACSW
jgi:aminopeptidase C